MLTRRSRKIICPIIFVKTPPLKHAYVGKRCCSRTCGPLIFPIARNDALIFAHLVYYPRYYPALPSHRCKFARPPSLELFRPPLIYPPREFNVFLLRPAALTIGRAYYSARYHARISRPTPCVISPPPPPPRQDSYEERFRDAFQGQW